MSCCFWWRYQSLIKNCHCKTMSSVAKQFGSRSHPMWALLSCLEAVEYIRCQDGGLVFLTEVYCYYEPCSEKCYLCRQRLFAHLRDERELCLCFGVMWRAWCLCTLIDPQISDLWLCLTVSSGSKLFRLCADSPPSSVGHHLTDLCGGRKLTSNIVIMAFITRWG